MFAPPRFHFSRLLTPSAFCLALFCGGACGYSIPDSTIAGASLWSSLQTGTLAANQLAVTASVSQVLINENVTFTPSGGTSPYTYRVSSGGGTITTAGVFTAGAVLGTNTITVTDSAGATASASVTVSGGQGDGTFAASNDYAAFDGPGGVLSGDFTGDGILDLVVGTEEAGNQAIILFVGNGNGTFQTGISNAAAGGVREVAVADFDADGNLDVAGGTTANKLVYFLGNADTTFQTREDIADAGSPLGVVTGDMDKDGNIDMIAGAISGDYISFYRGNGDGTFQAATTFGSLNGPRRAVVGDLNNDGNLDVVGGNSTGAPSTNPGATVYLGNGDGTFQSGVEYTAAANTFSLTLGDFNGDGRLDIVTFVDAANGDITVFPGNGDGTFQTGLVTNLAASGRPRNGAACDYDADGNMDLAVSDRANDIVVMLFGNGAGGFTAGTSLSAPGSPNAVHCRDLTGNGKMDIAMTTSNDFLRVFVGN